MKNVCCFLVLAIAATVVTLPTAIPADTLDYPMKGKPITIIVPWAPGAGNDVVFRLLARQMEQELATPVLIVNRPGASTQLGLTQFVQAKPDGYTLAATALPATNLVYMDTTRKAVFGRKDFIPIAICNSEPAALGVMADSPYKTTKDLVDAAKAAPGKIRVGDSGLMSPTHMVTMLFEKAAGVQFASVHFDGGGQSLPALLGNKLDVAMNSIPLYWTHIKSGQIRVTALADNQRSSLLPEVPTFTEQGYPVVVKLVRGLSALAGTRKEIVQLLSSVVKKSTMTEEFKNRMGQMKLEIAYADSAEYAAMWDQLDIHLKELMAEVKQQTQK